MNWKRRLLGTWSWKRPFISLLWIYVLLAIIAFFFGEKFLFRPPVSGYELDHARYHVIERDGEAKIAYTWLKPRNHKAPVFFVSHGNAEDISGYEGIFDQWQQAGCGVFAYDYPGYGLSEGKPTGKSVNESAERAWKFLREDIGIPANRVIIVGRSVGCGPSLALAQKNDHSGLILISPFRSAFQSVTRFPIFFGDLFPNETVIASVHSPLLIIHGEKDRVIPCAQGRALFDRSPSHNKTWLMLPDCGHNDLFDVHYDQLLDKMIEFAKANGLPS
jgi:alpha-beta hydrolase superfamily lysophospholipase